MAYKPNNGIRHDMMLLDNQLPYGVVEAVLNLRVVPFDLKKFIALWKDSAGPQPCYGRSACC